MKKKIIISSYSGGMIDRYFSRKIVIQVNKKSRLKKKYDYELLKKRGIETVSALVELFEIEENRINIINVYEKSSWSNVYIYANNILLGFQQDKPLSEVFSYFKKRTINFVMFHLGGASYNIENGYKLVVHSNEEIHKNTPHVHVEKNGYSVRYLILTAEK